MNRILIFKCKNCGTWNDIENDPECVCGAIIHEPCDPHATKENAASRFAELDLNKVADILGLND